MAEIKVEKTIYQKLQQDVRVPISKMTLKKTGYNKHLNYYYYQLDDFLPQATELISKAGLCAIFNIGYDNNGIEMASLLLTDGLSEIRFGTPTADVPNQNGIFNLGSKHTYCKRYLYMNLLELADPDTADMNHTNEDNNVSIEERKATKKQVEMIQQLYDAVNIAKMLEYYNIATLEEMTMKTASDLIARKNGRTN